jgi:hypothetical protein
MVFCGKFSPPSDQKKRGLANLTKQFLKLKQINSPYFEEKKSLKSPNLDNEFH